MYIVSIFLYVGLYIIDLSNSTSVKGHTSKTLLIIIDRLIFSFVRHLNVCDFVFNKIHYLFVYSVL